MYVITRMLLSRRRRTREVPLPRYLCRATRRPMPHILYTQSISRLFVTSDRGDRSRDREARRQKKPIATGSRWRTTATANYSRDFRCATIDPVFRSPRKLDSLPANGNPYLSEGIVIGISPRYTRRGDRRRWEGRMSPLLACLPAFVPDASER